MGQIVVIDPEKQNKNKYQEILSAENLLFIDDQANLTNVSEEIDLIIVDSTQNALLYVVEIRQKGILLPIILVAYQNQDINELLAAMAPYQFFLINNAKFNEIKYLINMIKNTNSSQQRILEPYLTGSSDSLNKIRKNIFAVARINVDIFLYSETGCGKRNIAYWLHKQSAWPGEFMELNLNNYTGADYEIHVWAALKEIYKDHPAEINDHNETIYSTLYIKGLEHKDILFIISLLEWIHQKRKNSQRPIRVVVAIEDKKILQTLSRDFLEKYILFELPSLAERKEDVPEIVQYFLGEFNQKFKRNISFLGADFLDYIKWYNWPGNIEELRYNLEAVFLAGPEIKKEIALRDLFINEDQLFSYCLQSTEGKNLSEAVQKLKKIGI